MASRGLWVRYGGESISDEQIAFAAAHYAVAILQPGQARAAGKLKELNPAMKVLCYKCLCSTRVYEQEPPFTSGVSFEEAQEAEKLGQTWFARRPSGEPIEWEGYPGHFQMNVWSPAYRQRWVENVTSELADSPFDGVMADNDFYGDYYGLNLPIRGARQLKTIHKGIDRLVREAGKTLNKQGKILVPNIAESRCDPGKWERHSAYGGGFEEVFLGWGAQEFLDLPATLAQSGHIPIKQAPVRLILADGQKVKQPRLTLLSGSTDGTDEHPNFLAALAGFWVFGAGQWTALTATGHDQHNGTPWIEELGWDLGQPHGSFKEEKGALVRQFEGGWAALNISDHASGALDVPAGLWGRQGKAPRQLTLKAHEGVVFRKG